MSQSEEVLYLFIAAAIGFVVWLVRDRSRRVLARAIGRDVQPGEETSVKAWMSAPADKLAVAHDELRNRPAEAVLATMEALSAVKHRHEEHEPYARHNSIR